MDVESKNNNISDRKTINQLRHVICFSLEVQFQYTDMGWELVEKLYDSFGFTGISSVDERQFMIRFDELGE